MDRRTWVFRAGFKHIFTGSPATALCSSAPASLVDDQVVNSDVDVPDVATCWLCLAIDARDRSS